MRSILIILKVPAQNFYQEYRLNRGKLGLHTHLRVRAPLELDPLFNTRRDSQGAQTVKNLPAMQETQVLPQGPEDPLEKEMATHSSILGWRIPWREESGRFQED